MRLVAATSVCQLLRPYMETRTAIVTAAANRRHLIYSGPDTENSVVNATESTASGPTSSQTTHQRLLNKTNNPIPIAGPAKVANTTMTNDLAAITLTPHYYKRTAN